MSSSVYRVFRPFRHLNQRHRMLMDPEEIFHALTLPRIFYRHPEEFFRQSKFDTLLEQVEDTPSLTYDKNKVQAVLDVQHFKPEEISVKITGDRTITIEGKHEEKQDEKGQIFRHVVNRFVLPKNCDISKIESKLSSDGVLTITAPTIEEKEIEHQSIPIMQTGEPATKKLEEPVESSDKKEK